MAIFYTDSGSFTSLEVTGSVLLSGSLVISGSTSFDASGLTGSLFGSSSFAATASAATSITFTPITASFASTASFVNVLTTLTASNIQLNNLTDTVDTNKVLVLNTTTNEIFTTASVGVGGTTLPSGSVSSSAFGSPSQGTVRAIINGVTVDVDTGVQTGDAPSFTGLSLTGVTDTTANNKLLVLNTSTNQLFTTTSNGALSASFAVTSSFSTTASLAATASFYSLVGTDIVSSSTQIPALLPSGSVSSSGFSIPSQGTIRSITNAVTVDLDTGLQITDSPSFTGLSLTGLTDTTSVNKVIVLNTATNQLFTTSSVGAGSGTVATFPFSGSAVITGSLLVSQSGVNNVAALIVSGPVYTYGSQNSSSYIAINSDNSGISASADLWLFNNLGNLTTNTYYLNAGINSSTYNVPNTIGTANEAFLTNTGSNLLIGNQTTGTNSTIKFFSGNPGTSYAMTITGSTTVVSGSFIPLAGMTGSVFSGSFVNILEMSMAVSGTIAANGTSTVTLDINQANYFTVSASVAGTTTWVVNNVPPAGRVQTFVLEYTNGGIKTNNWFTNTRWPAGVAPTLSSASANPDVLSFTTDDNGANWRGLLLQRGSA